MTSSGAAEGQQWHDDSSVPGVVSDFEETWVDAAYLNALETRLRDAEAALREISTELARYYTDNHPCWIPIRAYFTAHPEEAGAHD